MAWFIRFSAFFGLVIVFATLSRNPSPITPLNPPAPSSADHTRHPNQQSDKKDDPSNIHNDVAFASVTQKQTHPLIHDNVSCCDKKETEWYSSPEGWTAFFTFALTVVTAGLWCATFKLYAVSAKGIRDNRRAIVATAKSAQAAIRSAEAAERALADLERAYIYVAVVPSAPDSTRILQGELGMQIFIANISMQNLGKTPAMLRNFRGQFQICPHPPSELIDYPVKENDIPKGLAIGAGMERIEPISILLNDANREDILDQRNGLWACGEVTYEDILGKVHITGFCWFCRAVGEVSYTIHPSPLNRRITLSDTNSESA